MSAGPSSPPTALALLFACSLGCGAEDLPRGTTPPETEPLAVAAPPDAGPGPTAVASASASAAAEPDVPLGPPPRVTDACGRPPGKALPVKLTNLRMQSSYGHVVFTHASQIRKSTGRAPPEDVDFARERIVHVYVSQNPNARIASVVETAQEIVIGVDIEAYCGGPAPPSPTFDVVVPASGKRIRIDECRHGRCTGPPRP